MTQQIDPETLSYEELAAGAANPEQQEVTPAADQEVDEIVYRRVIDLGDGSGTQVFEGATPEDLIEKLANAQVHATRKIRELSQAQKQQTQQETPAEMTADERFVLGQRMLTEPDKVMAEYAARVRKEVEAELAPTREMTKAMTEERIAASWAASNPDFYGSHKNATRMDKWLRMEGLPVTPENISLAFEDLSESGLLEARPDNQDAGNTNQVQATRIAEPATRVVGQRRAASGLSARGSSSVAARSQELTEEELYSMPLDKLEALAQRQR